ncbi:MAG: long-chain fatty acid--CoA ligase [Cytophagales bacterium]|nr:long-chain fatty acid--CoA ligase [Cytophagales bacterium]
MRVFDLLFNQYTQHKLEDALCYKVKGEWIKYSTGNVISVSSRLSLALLEKGIKKGDKIGLISESRPEWNFIDFACQQIGAVLVPMYPNIGAKDYQYIIEQSEVKMLFVSNKEILANVKNALKGRESSTELFTINKIRNEKHWKDLLPLSEGREIKELKPYRSAVKEDDLLTIIYTSGTTGNPKGVMLTHKNLVSNVLAYEQLSNLVAGDRALSFLPLNHVYERMCIYAYIWLKISVYYAESIDTIGDNLKEVKPHAFTTVPRLLEKVYAKIMKTGSELGGIKKGIFNWAIGLGLKYDPRADMGIIYQKQLNVARKLVFSKWKEALGGNIKTIICGAAALQERLARVYWAAEIQVIEGYGLTETSPVVATSSVEDYRIGYVGKPLEGVEVSMADDGEILVNGPNLMKGYYKNDDMTEQVIQDGWFKTGDIGTLEDGYLKITERKKELFKTSGGLYIAPQQLEKKLNEANLIEQSIVVGEGEKFPAAIIVPNFEELIEEAGKMFIMAADLSERIKNPEIIKLFQKLVDKANQDFGRWEKIKDFRLAPAYWSIEGGELTPTMKPKRRVIIEKHKDLIRDMYKGDGKELFKDIEEVSMDELDADIVEKINEGNS